MKRFILIVTLFITHAALAETEAAKNSHNLQSLGSAWTAFKSIHTHPDSHDIMMGYAGADIAHQSPMLPITATA
jgi:hypothetical protein